MADEKPTEPVLCITRLEFARIGPSCQWTVEANGQLMVFDGDGRCAINGQVMIGAPGEPSFIRDGTAELMQRVNHMRAALRAPSGQG